MIIAQLLADSENTISPAILLAGPIAAAVCYWLLFQYYRNTNKTHKFEKETAIHAQPPVGTDVRVGERRRTNQSRIQGDNRDDHRRRVRRIAPPPQQPLVQQPPTGTNPTSQQPPLPSP